MVEIQRGTLLHYKGFDSRPSVEIRSVQLPGHPEYDGAMPGIAFRYVGKRMKIAGRKGRWFYPCRTADEFFADHRFANLAVWCPVGTTGET